MSLERGSGGKQACDAGEVIFISAMFAPCRIILPSYVVIDASNDQVKP